MFIYRYNEKKYSIWKLKFQESFTSNKHLFEKRKVLFHMSTVKYIFSPMMTCVFSTFDMSYTGTTRCWATTLSWTIRSIC